MLDNTGKLAGNFTFRTAPIGAGGFVTGIRIATTGRMLHKTDVFNYYIREPADKAWRQAMTPASLPAADRNPVDGLGDKGGYDIQMAPSNPDVIYGVWYGSLYKSTTMPLAFSKCTGFPRSNCESNGGPQRLFNNTLSIHPTNPSIVILGTNGAGVRYSTDGGATATAISGLPTTPNVGGSLAKYLTAFDPTQPNTVYIHVWGSGLWRSTTGVAGSFTLIANSPSTCSHLLVLPSGDVWMTKHRGMAEPSASMQPTLHKMTRAGVQTGYNPGILAHSVAVDPNNSSHIVVVEENGGLAQSYDGGANWTSHSNTRVSGEIAWLSNKAKPIFPSQILFDPVTANKLWVAEGVGVSYATPPAQGSTANFEFHDYSQGNEELVSTAVFTSSLHPVPILQFWDKPLWRLEDDTNWANDWSIPLNAGQDRPLGAVTIAFGVDYAIDDPSFLVGCVGQGSVLNGYSKDMGKTWTPFAGAHPDGWTPGGAIAVSNKNQIIALPSNNGVGVYSEDGGTTFKRVQFGGKTSIAEWGPAYYVNRKNLTADKTRAGCFMVLVNRIIPAGEAGAGGYERDIAGLWRTLDGGKTWTRTFAGLITPPSGPIDFEDGRQYWQAKLDYVPGRSGELVYTMHSDQQQDRFIWSSNDGTTWGELHPQIRNVTSFGFGKAMAGQARPAVYFYGDLSGVRGVYASFDWFATTPILLSEYPNGSLDRVAAVSGDMTRFGRCFVGFQGSGFAMCDYAKKIRLSGS